MNPSQELRLAASEVSSYRSTRTHSRAPFPPELWKKLGQLANLSGVEHVAKVAKVDVGTLRSHAATLAVPPAPVDFVECFVEERRSHGIKIGLESRSGDRMSIDAPSFSAVELGLLVREFLK